MNVSSFSPKNLIYKVQVWADRCRGLDFLPIIEPQHVGLDSTQVHRSSPSGNRYLENVFRHLGVSPDDAIIDIGCGKGSAMRSMLKFPFRRVDGLELSDSIANIARNNFSRLKMTRVRIYGGDARQFQSYDDYNFIYFYNPFPSFVMDVVMQQILASLLRADRKMIIVYNNPVCHDSVIKTQVFHQVAQFPDEWGNGINIYRN